MSGHTHIHTHIHTHTHTHTHDNYYNPRCAHAHRGLIITILLYVIIIINLIIINTGTEIITSCSVYTPRCSLASHIAHTVYS